MNAGARPRVVLLPGAVLPAAAAYHELLAELGEEVDTVAKDLELYRDGTPSASYSLENEVQGLVSLTDSRGWDRFHLVGYSAGGAAALASAARHPSRLLSLALLEPAWAGDWDWSPQHRELWAQYDAFAQLPPAETMAAFMRLQVRPDVDLPPPPAGPSPPWMQHRPAGVRALLRSFAIYQLDREALAAFDRPVYFALGGRSNPHQFAEEADRLGRMFADFTVEVFDDRHHFDPPHRVEPTRVARSLRSLWARGESAAVARGVGPE